MNDFSMINKNGCWCPSESDKEHMSQYAYDESLKEYAKFQSQLIFDNVVVEYESSDSEYSTGGYPTEIVVQDGEKNHSIIIEDDDSLIFYNNDGESEIMIRGLKKFTCADFIKICMLCGIKLKSKYIL